MRATNGSRGWTTWVHAGPAWFVWAWCVAVSGDAFAQSTDIDGLTEPYRTVEVAATEPGLITKLLVQEGDVVRQGQPLATLDSDVFAAMLAIAKQAMDSQGNLKSALADVQLKKDRLAKFEELRAKDHAREEELERARAELAIADARLLGVREDLEVRRLEFEKFKVQLDRRTVRSPLDGVVTRAHKDEGEYLAPNDPVIFTVVQLNPLLATFSVPAGRTKEWQTGQKIRVRLADQPSGVEGTVEFISPVTDAESGTVRVKVRLDNAAGNLRSGERCSLEPTGKVTPPLASGATTTPAVKSAPGTAKSAAAPGATTAKRGSSR